MKPSFGILHRSKDLNCDLWMAVQILIHAREPDVDRAWSYNGRLDRISKRLGLPAVGQGLYIKKHWVGSRRGTEIGQTIWSNYTGRLDHCEVMCEHLEIPGCDRAMQDDSHKGRFYGDGIGHRPSI